MLLEGGEGRKDVGVEATKERVGRAERGPLSGWSPLPGAAAEASTPTVGVGASTLSWPGLALFSVIRCVGLNRDFEVWEIH